MWLGLYTQQSSGHTRGFGCPLPSSEATRKTETCDRRAVRAATPHYRRPSGLYTAEMHLSQFWMPESPRSRRGQIQGLVRATFRVHTRHLLSCPHVAGEARGLFIRARIPFIRAHDPIAPPPRPHQLIPSPWGAGFSSGVWERGRQHAAPAETPCLPRGVGASAERVCRGRSAATHSGGHRRRR